MKKFVFISLPMNGREDKDIGNRLKEINKTVKEKAAKKFGWDISDIYTIDNFWDMFRSHVNGNRNLLCLGEAISKMDAADAVYFDEGWRYARGCIVENMAAQLYNVPIILYNEPDGGEKSGE